MRRSPASIQGAASAGTALEASARIRASRAFTAVLHPGAVIEQPSWRPDHHESSNKIEVSAHLLGSRLFTPFQVFYKPLFHSSVRELLSRLQNDAESDGTLTQGR